MAHRLRVMGDIPVVILSVRRSLGKDGSPKGEESGLQILRFAQDDGAYSLSFLTAAY